jgi:hypothetical protein
MAADMIGTAAELGQLLGETIDPADAALQLQLATGAVQGTVRQRLVQVADDEVTLLGTTDSWLDLPERPVPAVSSVILNGEEVTDYKPFGARLFRRCGWSKCAEEPGTVAVTYSHGYAPDDPGLALAHQVVLMLAVNSYANPTGSTSMSIDDYREGFAGNAGESWLTSGIRSALRKRYGRRGGLARLG